MFKCKQSYLLGKEPVNSSGLTFSGNGSTKHESSGNEFVDQFSFITNYRKPRPYQEIANDMEKLWKINPLNAVKLLFYIRLVTRKVDLLDGQKLEVQRGQGLKHEGIMRMIWVHLNHPDIFYQNLPLFVASGCWKDIFQMMSYDLQYHGWKDRKLDWTKLGDFILAGLENPNTTNLVKKYLPTIKAKSKAKTLEAQADTIIGKYLAHRLFGYGKFSSNNYHKENYKKYRKLKVSGQAHEWQQQISRGRLNINFSTVHGRALSILVSGKFLKNHNLEKAYHQWILTQPVAKFTGYVYELFKGLTSRTEEYKKLTIDKQFQTLINTAQENINKNTRFIVCRDTSHSMSSTVPGLNVTSHDVAKSMALFFNSMLEGPFAEGYLEFNSVVLMQEWKGKTATEKYLNDTSQYIGSTNFVGVAHYLASMRRRYPQNIFPTGVICISDGEFNRGKKIGAFAEFKQVLLQGGFTPEFVNDFKLVLWDIPNGYYSTTVRPKFEANAGHPNFYYMSGLDPSGIAFLMGRSDFTTTPSNAEELFEAAMNQELLNLILV